MRILLVEDDRMIGEAMMQALREGSYAVDWLRDGQVAFESFDNQKYDLVLLDLGLPNMDGLELLRSIRARGSTVALIIITARDSVEQRISGLDSGADDYLLKPFKMAELFARMRAVLRRKGGAASPVLGNGIISLDPATYQVSVGDTVALRLSAREFSLMRALLVRPGAILSRADLEEKIYGWGQEVESNAVEYLIHALRKKLGRNIIRNVRGVGWMVPR